MKVLKSSLCLLLTLLLIASIAVTGVSATENDLTVGTVKIDTKGAGEAIEFKVAPNADKTAVDFTFDNGTTVTMGPVVDESTDQMLQELDQLIAQVNNSSAAQ